MAVCEPVCGICELPDSPASPTAIEEGETVEEYPDDHPYPSRLLLAKVRGKALHVVVAREVPSETCYVVTAYLPDPSLWDESYQRRTS